MLPRQAQQATTHHDFEIEKSTCMPCGKTFGDTKALYTPYQWPGNYPLNKIPTFDRFGSRILTVLYTAVMRKRFHLEIPNRHKWKHNLTFSPVQ